jgi:Glycosyl hydrolase family 1
MTAALAATATFLFAGQAAASSSARFGIQDDAWLRWGPGTLDSRLNTLDSLGVKTVRFTLVWDEIAKQKPSSGTDPNDEAYDWSAFDPVMDGLRAHHITPLITLWGTPKWANGGKAPNVLPKTTAFGDFASAAAKHYPWVRMWTVWNEPNTRVFSVPVSPSLYVKKLLNPAYAALHRANAANKVAGGVTSPRQTASGMSPTTFAEGMSAAHAKLDAYAANPYPGTKVETPFHDPCSWCKTLNMSRLPQIRALVTRLFGASKQLWLTEYGYQTDPPDRILGVSYAKQAQYIGEAALRVWEQPGATLLIQFMVQDEPSLGGWQSGLYTKSGVAKPSRNAFALPLAQMTRSGSRTTLWGQVRPGSGARSYTIQRWSGGRWMSIGGTKRTGAAGTFRVTVNVPAGTKVRLTSPKVSFASPALVVS